MILLILLFNLRIYDFQWYIVINRIYPSIQCDTKWIDGTFDSYLCSQLSPFSHSLCSCCYCQTSLSIISIGANNNNKNWHKVSILARTFRYSVHAKMLCLDVFIISQWPFRQIICVYVAIERADFSSCPHRNISFPQRHTKSHENRRKKRNLWACMANCVSIEYVSRSHSRTLFLRLTL